MALRTTCKKSQSRL